MADGYVTRPKAAKKKIHSKHEFELCYLRHQYFRRADYNPTDVEMQPYYRVIGQITKNTFFTYSTLMHMIGMESEDLFNIGRVHLTSYLSLFSMFSVNGNIAKFEAIFYNDHGRKPTDWDCLEKDRANFTMFLKQRMEDLVRVCRQKARNVKGLPAEEFHMFYGPAKPPKILRVLVENFERYGFKRLDQASYRSVKRRAKPLGNVFQFNDVWYVAIAVDRAALELTDFTGAGLDPYDNLHNMTPESLINYNAEQELIDQYKQTFASFSEEEKVSKIKAFVEENKYNRKLRAEVKTARQMLVDMGVRRGR